jgi:Lrp/AsnC family transcriptional regulator, leucine-responsive regulatory protein
MELDRKDFALLEALQQDASLRLEDLAKLVKLAPSSVHDRLRRLQRSGIIRQWTIKVDAPRLGLGVQAFIGVTSSKTCTALLAQFEAMPNIEECHSVAGELCIFLKVRVPDTAALLALIERLREIDGVVRTETTIVLATQFDRPVALKSLGATKPAATATDEALKAACLVKGTD